jgi:hypothetical protein
MLDGDEAAAAASKSAAVRADSLALFERGLAIAESLWNSDEANLEGQRDLAIMLNKVGTVLIDLREWERARVYLDRSTAMREETFRTDSTHMHRQDLAQAILKRALLDRERVMAGAVLGADRAAVLTAAIEQFQRGVDHLVVLQRAGVLAEKDPFLVNGLRAIETCRKLLEQSADGAAN